MSKHFTLAALAAAAISAAALLPAEAQAQQARYCDGRINANSFYSNVNSTGQRSVVSYFMQLQSTGDAIRYTVTFDGRRQLHPRVTEAQSGSPVATLASYQQVTILLGKQAFNNPGGTGLLNATQMAQHTTVACPR